jgi:hypothetical protein
MYVASAFVESGIDQDWFDYGPNGGFAIGYDNAKYMTREPFVELVKKGLTGSNSDTSKQIAKLIATLKDSTDLVVVRKSYQSARHMGDTREDSTPTSALPL